MSNQIRLDKFLCEMGKGSRREVKEIAKKGRITVNGHVIKKADQKVDLDQDLVCFDGEQIQYIQKEYYMLNKPAGVISATKDHKDQTVLDLIKDSKRHDLFPVGRLDKDTVGLLLITNDGELAHNLLSPTKHISKTYYAKVRGYVKEEDIAKFKKGIVLEDNTQTKPAELIILKSGDISEVLLTIYEGKFHQVKRMFLAIGDEVVYLKRMKMGSLELDKELDEGCYRSLTEDEIELLINSQD